MSYFLSERSKEHRSGCHPDLIKISDLAIQITTIDFGHGPYSGKRTDEEQHELFQEGRSKADGYENRGKHQEQPDGYSHAIDFYAYVDNHASWEPEHLAMVATAFLEAASLLGIRVKWGGLWKSSKSNLYGWDMDHIQLAD